MQCSQCALCGPGGLHERLNSKAVVLHNTDIMVGYPPARLAGPLSPDLYCTFLMMPAQCLAAIRMHNVVWTDSVRHCSHAEWYIILAG